MQDKITGFRRTEWAGAVAGALLIGWRDQASAIHLQAATLTGIQTATNRVSTGIGLLSLNQPSAFHRETTSPNRVIVAGQPINQLRDAD